MLQYPDYTRVRLRQLAERLCARIYPATQAVSRLEVAGPTDRISYQEAQSLDYRPTQLGEQFGPNWATFWFRVGAEIPADWNGKRVDLEWISHSEAMLWIDGKTVQGLNYEPAINDRSARSDAILTRDATGGQTLEFSIEMACNRLAGLTPSHNLQTISHFVLDQCRIARFDQEAWDLYFDFATLQMLEATLSKNGAEPSWSGHLLYELNRFANLYNEDDRQTWQDGRAILRDLLGHQSGSQSLNVTAIGHGHIDTAWLWPLAETWRKCERTFSSQTALMDDYPDFTFACSQAAQYEVIREKNPDLYARIKAKIETGQWLVVGGSWIEPDCNIPSGEALCRQFLFGQRFFEREFGIRCREFWNPDVFGYNGQLPQILKLSGITRFLTQKLSWNRFNKPRHHTFTWQGIDGSEVFTHFPPTDTYNAFSPYDGKTETDWLLQNARDYRDHDRSSQALMLYGHGDGGGGPTRRMIEILERTKDLQGLPRTQMRGSNEFFDDLERDCTDRPTMVGELYFEYHRGTYTTQAAVKKGNRKAEWLLHDIEFLAVCAARLKGFAYPQAELERLWKLVLLNQFHDILPGSSIALVYQDAARDYAEIQKSGQNLRAEAVQALVGETGEPTPLNTIGFARCEVVDGPNGLVWIEAPPFGAGKIGAATGEVSVEKIGENFVLENEFLRAQFNRGGDLTSLIEKSSERESLSAPANRFELYDDRPTDYDAWDIDPFHLETRRDCDAAHKAEIGQNNALRAEIRFERKIGKASSIQQTVRLDAGARRLEFHTSIEWREDRAMLKVAFPCNVRALNATYEMQFGHVERPTHYTTLYDLAKYEVPGHKWADLSEHGFGVALLTESKYGFSTFGDTMRLSLLRAPADPDPNADRGFHEFVYALMPHQNGWREAGVVAEAHRFNVPFVWAKGAADFGSLFDCNDANLVLDTVKKAEDSDAIILRFYEAHGARGVAKVRCELPFQTACLCNILEEDGEPIEVKNDTLEVAYTPFQIVTLKLR